MCSAAVWIQLVQPHHGVEPRGEAREGGVRAHVEVAEGREVGGEALERRRVVAVQVAKA
jgi:hypothetical protein